jgi:hypothetical protein
MDFYPDSAIYGYDLSQDGRASEESSTLSPLE